MKFKIVFLLLLIFSQKIFCQEETNQNSEILNTEISSTESEEEIQNSAAQEESFFSKYFIYHKKSIFSFDTKYLFSGLKNNGWGLGISYERLILPFFSAKGEFSHSSIWPKNYDGSLITVGISLSAIYYPFCKGLNFFYIGFGAATDFLIYSDKELNNEKSRDILTKLFPQIGWKQNIFDYVLLDIFFGYRVRLSNHELPDFVKDVTKNGGEFGVKCKLNLGKIFSTIFNRSKSAKKKK